MKPLVSILIPAYNAESWLPDTIRSALAQTWPRKELIIVDDGSKDQTLAVAQSFASNEIKVVTHPNQGAAATRNKAFSLSQGDYVQWLDADDLLGPDKIELQMRGMLDNPDPRILLSSAWGYFVCRWHKAKFVPTSLWHDLSPAEWLVRKMSLNLHMQTATWLVSRELTEAAGPWDTRLLGDDDGEYFCRVLLASKGVRFVPGAKLYYRRSGPSSLSYIGHSDRKMEAQLVSMRLHLKYLRSLEDSERVHAACVTYMQNWLVNFYPERPDLVAELEKLAAELGGRLTTPRLSWKYQWIQKLFGWPAAKKAQVRYNRYKTGLIQSWDRALFRLEKPSLPAAHSEPSPSLA